MKRIIRVRPTLAYRRRFSFDAYTDKIIERVAQMEETAVEDAEALLAALPDMRKLEEYDGTEHERHVFAYLFDRAMKIFSERANPFSLIEVIDIVERNTRSARALRQHTPKRQAREWVESEWRSHRDEYGGNKSAFARDYSARLRNERGLKVSDKQIREVWLRDPPSASRPAGVPASGE